MDNSHGPRLVDAAQLLELRQRRGWLELWDRCIQYVWSYRNYRRILSREDAEDIVSGAIAEELESILDPELDAPEVSLRLGRALNRNRSVEARRAKAQTSDAPDPSTTDDPILKVHYKETAREFRGFLGMAIDLLGDRDRNLLIDQYRLDRFGFEKHGASPELSNDNARKVAQCRARQRFAKKFNLLLVRALAEGHSPDMIRSVRVLLQSRVLAKSATRKTPPTNT